MNIIFDLDGTLIDSEVRLYQLFNHLAPTSHLSHVQYWELKKNKFSHEMILKEILGLSEENVTQFVRAWMHLIESPSFLALDTVFPHVQDTLVRLGEHASLHLCTARQYRLRTLEQLSNLGLLSYFQQIMVTEQQHSKAFLFRKQVRTLRSKDWILGDTGKDILAGKELGIKTCAVLNGFLSKNKLIEYRPDLIIESVADFLVETTNSKF